MRGFAGDAGADTHGLTDIQDKDLSVPNGAAVRGLLRGFNDVRREVIVADDFDLDLRNHVRAVFSPAIDFRLAFLPSEALHFADCHAGDPQRRQRRSEEHTSELQSLMRISYAVFCLKKKKINIINRKKNQQVTHIQTHTTKTT